MSNKTQLATNNTQLASLIQTLQGKAAGAGGASVETANVAITSIVNMQRIVYTSFDDGVMIINCVDSGTTFTLTNVACNTPIFCITNNTMMDIGVIVTGVAEIVYGDANGEYGYILCLNCASPGDATITIDNHSVGGQ